MKIKSDFWGAICT